jgi:hypothetical protein
LQHLWLFCTTSPITHPLRLGLRAFSAVFTAKQTRFRYVVRALGWLAACPLHCRLTDLLESYDDDLAAKPRSRKRQRREGETAVESEEAAVEPLPSSDDSALDPPLHLLLSASQGSSGTVGTEPMTQESDEATNSRHPPAGPRGLPPSVRRRLTRQEVRDLQAAKRWFATHIQPACASVFADVCL